MKITTYSHIFLPGRYFAFGGPPIPSIHKDSFCEMELMPGSIESWSERKENFCPCGKDQYKGKFHITTKSGHQYTIVEDPRKLEEIK